jgi:ribosomal protein S8
MEDFKIFGSMEALTISKTKKEVVAILVEMGYLEQVNRLTAWVFFDYSGKTTFFQPV